MIVYILTREINDSITNVLGVYKNKEQAEQEVMLNKKKDDIILQISKKYLSLHPLNSNEGLNR